MIRPRRLTLYLLSELGVATLVGVVVWTAILLMNDLFFVARQAIQKDLALGIVFHILGLKVPNLLILAIPMGTLLGSLVAVGRLSADGEFTALQAAGLGPAQFLRPMLIHGTLTFLAAFSIYAFIQPWASYELRILQGKVLSARNVSTELRPRVFFDRLPGYVLFVDEIQPGTQGELERTILYEAPKPNEPDAPETLILAKEATLGPAAGGDGRLRILFKDGVQHSFRVNAPESYQLSQFHSFSPPPLALPAWMRPAAELPQKTVADMTPRQLVAELHDAEVEPDRVLRSYRIRWTLTEIHRRLALPLASMLFAVLALPLGVSRVRSGKGAGFALSLGIVLIYYLIFTVGLEQAKDGRIPPWSGIWAANVVVLVWLVISYLGMRAPARSPIWSRLLALSVRAIDRRRAEPQPGNVVRERRRSGRMSGFRPWVILDRYIIKLYLKMLGLSLASTYLIFTLLELKGLIDAVLERKQPATLILSYFRYFFPGVLVLTLPFAAMIAAVVTLTLLARNGELTALKASGMSARRVCVPILITTLLSCGILYLVQDQLAPETNRRAQAVKDQIQGRNPRTYGWTPGGRWTFGTQGRLYHYLLFDPQGNRFQGLSVYRLDLAHARVLDQWFCNTAQWSGTAWEADKGWFRSFPESGSADDYRLFENETVTAFDPPESFTRRERTLVNSDLPEQSSLHDLREQIDGLKTSGYDTTRLRVEFWQKTSSVATPLVTVLLGLPFAFKVGRRGSMYGVGVGLVLAIVFWAVAAISNALGLETILPAVLSAWAPNVLFGVIGAYLLLFIPT